MRPIHKVCEAIKLLIPSDYKYHADLFYELNDIIDEATYASTEITGYLWYQLIYSLEIIGVPDVKWKKDIQDLMSSKVDYRAIIGE